MLDYSYLVDQRGKCSGLVRSSEIGIRGLYRSLDENSPGDEFQEGENEHLWQTVFYVNFRF